MSRNPIICADNGTTRSPDNGTTRSPDSGLMEARSVRIARATPSLTKRMSFVSPS